jgi:hypothetical protein
VINKEQFGIWKSHPATRFFLKYVRDFRESGESTAMSLWLDGSKEFKDMAEFLRGQITTMREIEDLSFDAIDNFYKEKDSAASNFEDDTR